MSNQTIRIGFVGAGANTKLRHLPGFKAIDGVKMVSVANRSRGSSERIANEWDLPKIYDNWHELIAATDTDAICIGTWPYMHRTLVLSALEKGKHVLTEARMAMNAREAHEMMDASLKKPGLITQVVPSPLTLKVDSTIKDLIADGYLGDLLSVDLISHQDGFIDPNSPLHWRHERDLSGNNIMMMGIWYEALLRWIGPASSVSAITRVHVKSRASNGGHRRYISVPDHVELICEMIAGPVAHMRFTSITGHAPPDGVWLFGTEGTIHLDASTQTLSGGRKSDNVLSEIHIPPGKQGNWRVEEEFVNAIRGFEPVSHTSFEDGVKYMEFTEAVARSSQEGRKITLPLSDW